MEDKKKEPVKLPERKKVFVIKENSYDVEFPTTRQLYEIDVLKAQLSSNQYNGVATMGTMSALYSRNIIDMIATFNTIFPKLRQDLRVEQIGDLNPLDAKELLKVYLNEVLPWLNAWFEILNTDYEPGTEFAKS